MFILNTLFTYVPLEHREKYINEYAERVKLVSSIIGKELEDNEIEAIFKTTLKSEIEDFTTL
jgi:hypothetical protein